MKKMVSWILSLAMLSLALLGCVASAGATEAADELPVIRVGVIPGASSSLPFFYVHEQGWDAENGFTLEILTFNSGAPANEAMLAGEIDCSVIGGAATVAALANQGAKMIMEICNDAVGVSVLGAAGLRRGIRGRRDRRVSQRSRRRRFRERHDDSLPARNDAAIYASEVSGSHQSGSERNQCCRNGRR